MTRRTLYDRPVRELLAEAVEALTPPFKPIDIVQWFRTHYPRVNDKTVRAHIRAGTVNDPNRLHYSMRVGNLLYRRGDGLLDRYDPANPPEDAGDWADQPVPDELPDVLRQAGAVRITGNSELLRRRNYDIVKRVILDGQTPAQVAALHGMRRGRVARIVALAKGAPSKHRLADSVYFDESAQAGAEPDSADALGSRREEESRAAATEHFQTELMPAVLSLSEAVTQGFDLVSEDESVVGMLVPSPLAGSPDASLGSVSHRVWLLERLEASPSVKFVVSGDRNLLATWLSHYGKVAEGIDFYVLQNGALMDVRGEP